MLRGSSSASNMRRHTWFFGAATAADAAGCSDDGGSRKCSISIDSNGAVVGLSGVSDPIPTAAAPVEDGDEMLIVFPQNGHSPRRPVESAGAFNRWPHVWHRTIIDIRFVSPPKVCSQRANLDCAVGYSLSGTVAHGQPSAIRIQSPNQPI